VQLEQAKISVRRSEIGLLDRHPALRTLGRLSEAFFSRIIN